MSKRVLVIGGGAAGMMAAISAAEHNAAVTLLEPNERLGKKLNITGKGRCNVTNNADQAVLLANVPKNGKFLYSAFSRFDGRDTMAFFEKLGVPLKTERGNRVFPVSDRAFDISGALEKRLRALRVTILRDRAVSLEIHDGAVTGAAGEKGRYQADAVILATGGVSYPATGSTGDGYKMAAGLGHPVVEPAGSLVPLESDDPHCAQMQGLSLRNAAVKLLNAKGKVLFKDFGELLFTHFGVSGPTVLSASAHMKGEGCKLLIDLKPALDEGKLDSRLLRDLEQYQNRTMENALTDLLPRSMIPVVLRRLNVDPALQANSFTKQNRRALIELLKNFTVEITGKRPVVEAIITSGGVKVGEIDPKTMESKKVPGLYFAGEIIDCDAYTGGFNLQIAWATAYAAGKAVGGT